MKTVSKYYFWCLTLLLFIGCTNGSIEPDVEIEELVGEIPYLPYISPCEWDVLYSVTDYQGLIIKDQNGFSIVDIHPQIHINKLSPCLLAESLMKDSLKVVFSGNVKYKEDYLDARASGDMGALPLEVISIRAY